MGGLAVERVWRQISLCQLSTSFLSTITRPPLLGSTSTATTRPGIPKQWSLYMRSQEIWIFIWRGWSGETGWHEGRGCSPWTESPLPRRKVPASLPADSPTPNHLSTPSLSHFPPFSQFSSPIFSFLAPPSPFVFPLPTHPPFQDHTHSSTASGGRPCSCIGPKARGNQAPPFARPRGASRAQWCVEC